MKDHGFSVPELLATISILGTLAAVSVPLLSSYSKKQQLHAASRELRAIFHQCRSRAIATNRNVGVKFQKVGDRWTYAIYEDGDWDGVRNDDIRSGKDLLIETPREVLQGMSAVRIDLPPFRLRDPDTKRVLSANASPVRFGRSTICAFSHNGSATPGSIFLTDGHEVAMIVRVFGATGRIRSLRYDRGSGQWETR